MASNVPNDTRPPAKRSKTMLMEELKEESKTQGKENIADCQKQTNLIEQNIDKISSLEDKLFQMSNDIDVHIISKANEMKEEIKVLRKELWTEKHISKAQVRGLKTNEKQLKDLNVKLQVKSDFQETVSIIQKAEDDNNHINLQLKGLKDYISRQKKVLLKVKKDAKTNERKISNVKRGLNSKKDDDKEDRIEPINQRMVAMAIKDKDVSGDKITVIDLLTTDDDLKKTIQENKIYAFHQNGEEKRYAKIRYSQTNSTLLVHHLRREEHLPSDAKFIEFHDAMSLASLSPSVFLDLGVELNKGSCSFIGRIKIKLFNTNQSNFSLNFSFLCTGEKGPTYVGSNIWGVGEKGKDTELLCMGDYEGKNGLGGKGIVPGVEWMKEKEKNIHRRESWVKGLVGQPWKEEEMASLFSILTRENRGFSGSFTGIFGMVEEGLETLTTAISIYPNTKQIKVIDCGTILSS